MDNAAAAAQTRQQPSESNIQEQTASRRPTSRRFPASPESLEQPGDEGDEGPYSTDQAAAQSIELSRSRFVGDMIPESIFIEAASKSVVGSSLYRAPSDVGAWLPRSARRPDDEHGKFSASRWTTRHGSTGAASADDGPTSLHTLSGHLSRPYSARNAAAVDSMARNLAVCPPEDDYQQLQSTYLECIHPMLPVLSEADINESRRPNTLKHSIFRQVGSVNHLLRLIFWLTRIKLAGCCFRSSRRTLGVKTSASRPYRTTTIIPGFPSVAVPGYLLVLGCQRTC